MGSNWIGIDRTYSKLLPMQTCHQQSRPNKFFPIRIVLETAKSITVTPDANIGKIQESNGQTNEALDDIHWISAREAGNNDDTNSFGQCIVIDT